ncbi:adenosine deaminase [Bradymonadaceae bacterium TMQ3]|uniref:adenosine deaminase n=1 Tax=Lujinxingia sediminis TaxID=2480984 RepID=A0ABY0CVW8_9DELT|nr:adenosine deaminase [Lujinxingia sediminis]RDV36679.1 adenosine deaminase [Bradymonadaceae bacterium TMQ3]RVU46930.1 adenosine deaminase [Lujinxingia sediminis]TXC68540.1 adenosine deaminase [Bradymonadales bacterium TMQ1]
MKITRDFIHRMPKTDLHVHLDGSMRLSTILELAEKEGIALPGNPQTDDELARAINIGAICEDLTDYLKAFDVTLSVMQTEESLYRAAFELGEDAARENVKYMEVRYSPLLHTRNGLSYPVIVEAVAEGLREAKRRYGLMSGQIICGIRHMTPESSLRMAELCVAFKNRGVVGFDLAGAEADNPAKDYREAFYLIRNNNVNLTIHAGEAYGPESIHQAIHLGGAHRIGHGTRLREDGDLLNFLNDHRIPLEVCLTSNVQTRAAKSFESHPLPFYMSYGLRCTINTDNRLITDTTMTDEYWRAVQHYDLNIGDLRKLMIDGFKSAFMPYRKKRTVTAQACAEFDALVRDFETSSGEKATTDPRVAQEIAFQKASADARTPLIYHIQPEDRRPESSDADADVDSDHEQPSPAE